MSRINFFDGMRTSMVSEPPCTGCESAIRCELDELACKPFHDYAEYNKFNKEMGRFPTRKIYNQVFFEELEQPKLL